MESVVPALVAVLVLVIVLVFCLAVFRVVPAGHVGVTVRGGRAVRTRPSGVLASLPLVERVVTVPLRPPAIEPLLVTATTRDAVEIRLVVSALWEVTDPARAALAGEGLRDRTAEAVERAAHRTCLTLDLVDLLRDRALLLDPLPRSAAVALIPYGVRLGDVELLDAELRLGPGLLRLLC